MAEPATAAVLRVGVVGAGQMGAGIAEVCARGGFDVVAREVDDTRAARGRERIERSLSRAVERGKLSREGRAAALDRIRLTTDIDALADRQLIVEAIGESEMEKKAMLALLDRTVADPEAILGSNTSSIPIARLAAATRRPEAVIGLHFFYPVPILPHAHHPCARPRRVRAQRHADPVLLSAIRMLEGGFAVAEDIDASMVVGCGHPMGPLPLADFIGLDTVMSIANSLHDAFGEPLYAPPALLVRMVAEGRLGRKTGGASTGTPHNPRRRPDPPGPPGRRRLLQEACPRNGQRGMTRRSAAAEAPSSAPFNSALASASAGGCPGSRTSRGGASRPVTSHGISPSPPQRGQTPPSLRVRARRTTQSRLHGRHAHVMRHFAIGQHTSGCTTAESVRSWWKSPTPPDSGAVFRPLVARLRSMMDTTKAASGGGLVAILRVRDAVRRVKQTGPEPTRSGVGRRRR